MIRFMGWCFETVSRNLVRRLHILPNGERLEQERVESEERRKRAQVERARKIARAERIAEKIRSGEDGAPMSMDGFMSAIGFTPSEREEFREGTTSADDEQY